MALTSDEVTSLARAFGDNTARATGLVSSLTIAQVNWTPGPHQWSVCECLDHLAVTARLYQPILRAAIESGRQRGLEAPGPFTYGWFSRWFEAQLEPPPRRKFTAPAAFRPATGSDCDPARVLEAFQAVGREWYALLVQTDGLDLRRVKVASPVASWLRFPLGAALRQQAAHERRHLWQAEQLPRHHTFPRVAP